MGGDESILQKVPLELRQSRRWLVWKYGDAQPNGKPKKLPCNPVTGDPRDKLDSEIWQTMDEALALVNGGERFQGCGLVIDTPFIGVDLDKVRDPETGKTEPWALDLIRRLDSYTELSPSGTGYHIWLHGKAPKKPGDPSKPWNHRCGRVEVYSQWWFTTTGRHVAETPENLRRLDDQEVAHLFAEVDTLDPPTRPSSTPQEAGPRLRPKTKELLAFDPTGAPDQSGPVHSLLIQLLIDTTLDTEAAETLFKKSVLYTSPASHWGTGSKENKWARLRDSEFHRALPQARTVLNKMLRSVRGKEDEDINPDAWPEMFHTYDELTQAKEMSWVIGQIAQEQEITIVGGLAKHGKTWFLLATAKALLSGEPLFGHFPVVKQSTRVLYLIPEVGMIPFKKRLVLMRLMEYVRTERLFVRTLSKGQIISLTDPRILKAAEGADVFLDTAIRFIDGDEKSASDIKNSLSRNCLGLLEHGARSLFAAHHSPKAFGNSDQMTLETVLRGSGDIGAMLSNAYGLRQIDEARNLVHVECLCGRDLDKTVEPFQIEGRPHVNEMGNFKMVARPGEIGPLADHVSAENRGRPSAPDKDEKTKFALTMKKRGRTIKEIAEALNNQFHSAHGESTISHWLRDAETQMDLLGGEQ